MPEKVSTVHRGAGQASTRGGGGARARPGGCDMASQSGAIKRPGRFPGINVDGFQFQSPDAKVYVLTHFHADHYCGLSSSFGRSKGSTEAKIYCSTITAALVVEFLGVNPELVVGCEIGETVALEGVEDVEATFIDANHCPGACLVFLRRKTTGETLLHTGDFRAAARVRNDARLKELLSTCRDGCVDEVYLDTTYCEKKWTFPDQDVVLNKMREIAREETRREPRTLFLCGSYSIGKERAIRAVCQGAESRARVTARRKKTLELSGWWRDDLFVCEEDDTEEAAKCRVRVGKGSNHKAMMELMAKEAPTWRAVVAFSPTGWSYTKSMDEDGCFQVKPWIENDGHTRMYAIPYSEHSSYTELREFINFLKPKKITPTVNASTPKEREKLVNKHFLDLVDLRQDMNRLDFYFKNGGSMMKKQKKMEIIILSDGEDDKDDDIKLEAEVITALDGDLETIRRQREMWQMYNLQSKVSNEKKQTLEPFPLECIAVVRNGDYNQFRSRAHVEQRLKELGATIMSRVTSNVTHIIVPNKGELANEAARLDALRQKDEYKDDTSAHRVTEAWVMRHVRAKANGCALEHSEVAKATFAEKKRQEKIVKAAEAKRKREEKKSNVS